MRGEGPTAANASSFFSSRQMVSPRTIVAMSILPPSSLHSKRRRRTYTFRSWRARTTITPSPTSRKLTRPSRGSTCVTITFQSAARFSGFRAVLFFFLSGITLSKLCWVLSIRILTASMSQRTRVACVNSVKRKKEHKTKIPINRKSGGGSVRATASSPQLAYLYEKHVILRENT